MIKIPVEARRNQSKHARPKMSRPASLILLILTFLLGLALGSGLARAQDVISTFAGGGPNNLPAISANVDQPTSVAVASSTVFYIASPIQNRVFKVDTSATSQFTVFAGNGTPGYSGDAGLAVNASLRSPQAVALDSSGNVFIADTQNNVVRVVNTQLTAITVAGVVIQPGKIATVAGNGGSGFSGDGGGGVIHAPGTPAGPCTLTVNATSGSLTHNIHLSLNVN